MSQTSTRRSCRQLLALLVLGLLGTHVATPARAAGAPAGTFTMRLLAEPMTLDWNRAHTPIENYLLYNLMEGLVTLDQRLKVAPALAERWKVSPDGKTYTFWIRPGVRWSDGVVLRAQDFVASWKRLLTATTAASYAYLLFDVVGAKAFFDAGASGDFSQVGIRALDDRRLEVKLTHSIANWIYIPTFWVTFPMREDVLARHGSAWTQPGKMVSVGPYLLDSHEPENQIVLKPNPHYYGKRGNIARVVGRIVRDDATALTLFESGGLDYVTDLSVLDVKRLSGRPELKRFPYLKTAYLGFSAKLAPVDDPQVRRALAYAIDRSQFARLITTSDEPASSFVPRGMAGFSADIGLKFDPARGRELLKGVKLPPLTILSSTLDRSLMIAQFVQSQLKQNLGVESVIESYDHKTFRAQLSLKRHPLFVMSWSADYPDPDNYLSLLTSSSGNNRTGWSDPKFDLEVERARVLRSESERRKIYHALQKQAQEQAAALLPLYYEPNVVLVSRRTRGLVLNPINYLLLREVDVDDRSPR